MQRFENLNEKTGSSTVAVMTRSLDDDPGRDAQPITAHVANKGSSELDGRDASVGGDPDKARLAADAWRHIFDFIVVTVGHRN